MTYTVRDNGAGSDTRSVEKLFVPFQRLHGGGACPGAGVRPAGVQHLVQRLVRCRGRCRGGRALVGGEAGTGVAFRSTVGEGSP